MDKQRLFELYEKVYFHEMEVREKITGRVQLTFALVATGYTILSYMLRMLDTSIDASATHVFLLACALAFGLSFVCLYFLVRAFWGNTYQGLPSPIDIDKYREELIEYREQIRDYNKNYPSKLQEEVDVDKRMKAFLYQRFRDCADHNTDTNDKRSRSLHHSFKWLLFACIPMLVASSTFIYFDLDSSSPRKETPIHDKSVVKTLSNLEQQLAMLNLTLNEGVHLVSKNEENVAPPPPPPPQEPDSRPLVENDTILPNAGE